MKILFKTSLALAAAVMMAALSGCNDSDLSSENTQSQSITDLPVSDMQLGGAGLNDNKLDAELSSEKGEEFTMPETLAELTAIEKNGTRSINTKEVSTSLEANKLIKEMPTYSPRLYVDTYTPGCTELAVNTAYNFVPNQNRTFMPCFYFDIPQNSRAEFFAISQSASRQVDLYANHDIPANYTLTFVGSSTESDADDNVPFWAEPGHYYYLLDEQISDGGQILIGAAVREVDDEWENIDSTPSYVGNDTPESATIVANGYNQFMIGRIDSGNDVDHFLLNSYWGQDLTVLPEAFFNTGANEDILFDVFLNNTWVNINNDEQQAITGFPEFGQMLVRVRPRSTAAVYNDPVFYFLNAGSLITNLEDLTPDGDRAARVSSAHSGPWARVQNAYNFTWKVKATDSTDNPVRGTQISFTPHAESGGTINQDSAFTDYQGIATNTDGITHNGCAANAQNQYLNIIYQAGYYHIRTTYYQDYSVIENPINEPWLWLCTDY